MILDRIRGKVDFDRREMKHLRGNGIARTMAFPNGVWEQGKSGQR
jgi:hypothetical protein